jgi:hypothetical protein
MVVTCEKHFSINLYNFEMGSSFVAQLVKDYEAWASGDSSRKPLGTGEI